LIATIRRVKSRLESIAAVLLGIAVTYIVYGYQFGTSNHTVYLLSALRETNPQLLARDWFTTQTLQYHAAFGWLTFVLNKLHILQPAFWIGYLLLVAMLHIAWFGIVRLFSGTKRTYLLSVVLYHLSAGGTGLGMYQFLQDSSFLPSNIASVALLWGLYLRMRKCWISAAICFAIAELFHLNYALVGVGLWLAISVINTPEKSLRYLLASLIALAPGLINAAVMIHLLRGHGPPMPLKEFIDLYVHLRHPHHYDLRSWPAALWISFVWPMPFAFRWLRRELRQNDSRAPVELAITSFLLAGLILIAIAAAGIGYLNESLVQMSLYRFTIYLQLFGIIATAIVLTRSRFADRWIAFFSGVGILLPIIVVAFIRKPLVVEREYALIAFGIACTLILLVSRMPTKAMALLTALVVACVFAHPRASGIIRWTQQDDRDYLEICDWARDHTPIDSILLTPPDETEMRLRGRRAIVVNYKCVPQLSSELPQWRDRLQDVLALQNLMRLPKGFNSTLAAIREQYDSLTGEHLTQIAKKYDARYLVATHRLMDLPDAEIVYRSASDRYFVYDLARD
jgi:hypothetical protein